jgi:beta-galactosidase
MLIGGFIWEWADQTVYKTSADGTRFAAYGGDFGEYPNDGDRCVKGLVSAERLPRPQYWEAQKVFQYIKVTADAPASGRIRIHNKYFFTDLSGYAGEWRLEEEGRAIATGQLPELTTGPGIFSDRKIPSQG